MSARSGQIVKVHRAVGRASIIIMITIVVVIARRLCREKCCACGLVTLPAASGGLQRFLGEGGGDRLLLNLWHELNACICRMI